MTEHTQAGSPHISKFTLGTAQLGMKYGMANRSGQPDRRTAFDILNTAREVGVNSLDTAAAYGESEQVVGSYQKENGHPMLVTSKFSILSGEPLAELGRQIDTSRKRLGQVDGYMFHSADQLRRYGVMFRPALENMKREGNMAFIGASVYTAQDVEDFLECEWLGAIQLPMSILDTRIVQSGLLEELKKRNIHVFVRSVFLQGLLCMNKAPERFAFLQPFLDQHGRIALEEGMTLAQMAVCYVRDLPGVSSLVLGCETPQQVRDNARLIDGRPLSQAARAQIDALGRRVPIEKAMDIILGKA